MLKKIHVCQIPVLFVKTPVAPSHLVGKWPRWKSRFTDWNHPISAGELFIPFSTTTPSPRWRIFAVQWTRKTFVYNLLGYLLAVVVVLILYAFVRKHVKKTPSAHSNSGFRIRIFFSFTLVDSDDYTRRIFGTQKGNFYYCNDRVFNFFFWTAIIVGKMFYSFTSVYITRI